MVKLPPAQINQIVAAQNGHQGEQAAPSDWWMVRLTGGLLLVALGQAVLFVWQLGLIRRANKVAQDAATVANQSVTLAKETAQHQLRVYINVGGGKIWHQRTGFGRHLEWRVDIVNVGQTPAYNVRVVMKVGIRPEPLPELAPKGDGSRGDLGPGQAFYPHAYENIFSDERVDALKGSRRTEAFYVWGLVTYSGVFKQEHRSRFCFVADYDTKGDPISRVAPQDNQEDY
jgi:hypothetical protein